jgi:murein DD-endopeptidase MepM/ murein hydrolase activator NlpD
MTTTPHHLNRLLAAFAAALAVAAFAPSTGLASYGWPVKPFNQPHPVRGSFGDPRTIFAGLPTEDGLLHGSCQCTFHEGVDISAPDGTPVYAVESGTVTVVHTQKAAEMIAVASGNTGFEYWHITASVKVGQQVVAGQTVLGHILPKAGHVHLTEVDAGQIVNPLQTGHLTPYHDTTTPVVSSISFQAADGSELIPNFLRGSVEIIANAYDTSALPVRGIWHGMPVTPALLTWQIEQWNGKPVGQSRAVYDVRHALPANSDFWRVYARGSFQNMSVFANHYSWLQPGCFLFRLTPGGFDTHRLTDGVYAVVVTATDIAGNSSSSSARFTVHNRPGFKG